MNEVFTSSRKPRLNCEACALGRLCLPEALDPREVGIVESFIRHSSQYRRGDVLFEHGDAFLAVRVVKSGALKSVRVSRDGEEQVAGFHLPGDLVGLDALGGVVHGSSAVALEDALVCELPYRSVSAVFDRLPRLRDHLLRHLGRELNREQDLLMLMGRRSAEERIASFLLEMSARFARLQFSPTSFRLPMSRLDIGNHLGLAIETVSRAVMRMQRRQVILTAGRNVEILDLARLCTIAGVSLEGQASRMLCASHA